MNKQALAFMSMFTLVLMLSIYYVSLDDTLVNQPTEVVQDISSVMSLMKEQNLEATETLLSQLKEQLGSSQISEEKKEEILNKISKIEKYKEVEEKIVQVLEEKSIKSVVHIEDEIVHVSIFDVEKSDKKAEEIMKIIYPQINNQQTIELSFS